ncbi:MAG: hypothetical protein KAJ64_00350, partial [Thermoplasmata archaeon]|nr:hypothetical protein [Thermoplasmata archaeon]
MKLVSVFLAAMILLAIVPASAQELPAQVFQVPASGYSNTDSYFPEDLWNEYQIQVPMGHELEYSFEVTGPGDFSIYLIPEIGTGYIFQGSYYISFSSDEPVTSYSATFPADFGFDQEYTIVINSTYNETLEYTASISINEIETPDYTIYYLLVIFGFIGLAIFSWRLVLWQDKQEKKAEQAAREQRKSRR